MSAAFGTSGGFGNPKYDARFPETNMAGGLALHSHTGRHESGGAAAASVVLPQPQQVNSIKGVVNLPLRSAIGGATMSLSAHAAPTR